MNRFNLTFSGEVLDGHDPAKAKLRFARMFAIDDPVRLDRFFSGQTIILRRNLERKAAAQYYHDLQLLGLVVALVKVTTSDAANAVINAPPSPTKKLPDTSSSKVIDAAAQIKARKIEALRLAAEKEAVEKAILEQQQRLKEEETARREAAAREEKERKAAAAAARLQAELEATKRREAEEAARRQAEREALKRREAEEAARLRAEQLETKRQEAEEAARLHAELEVIKRREEEEAARIKAEAKQRQAEARRKSEERRRAAAEQLAAQQAQRKEEKRRAATQKAEQKAQKAQQAREQAEDTARQKAEQLNREAKERLEQEALSAALQEKAAQRAAAELAQPATIKAAKARVKTRLETPQRKIGQPEEVGAPVPRKRQLGEPNIYTLRPFRCAEEVRNRAVQANRLMSLSYRIAVLAMVALLLAAGSYLRRAADPVVTGADAITISPGAGPLLLAQGVLLFHDRAGVSKNELPISALGLSAMAPPLTFDGTGALLALGRLAKDDAHDIKEKPSQLLRCNLATSTCQRFSPQLKGSSVSAFALQPLDGSVLLADSAAGELLKVNRAGKIVARAAASLPSNPVLRLHDGLLFINSAEGPGVSVLRYEDGTFGQQLDEILLLPPASQKADHSRVGDFVQSGDSWWASLHNPETGSRGLHRFDNEWNYLAEIALPEDSSPVQLSNWGSKTLVSDPQRLAIQRFNAEGESEAPFVSKHLSDLIAGQQRHARLTSVAWRGGLALCFLTAALGFAFGYLHSQRTLVYKSRREHGAEPVDDYADTLQWIDPVTDRPALLRRNYLTYGILAVGILLPAIALNVTTSQLAALLLALGGPAAALFLLSRYPIGHIGVVKDHLLLVDHNGMYHFGAGSSVQHHGPFLAIDDVVVFCGSSLLPAFPPAQLEELVRPLARGGVKVDRNTMLIKLLECRHPLAQGAFAVVAGASAAIVVLSLTQII